MDYWELNHHVDKFTANADVCTAKLHEWRQKGANISLLDFRRVYLQMLYFDPRPGPKMLFQGNTPEGSDTFQRPVIERDRVGGLRLMIWEKVKVPFCHYSHAPEESNL